MGFVIKTIPKEVGVSGQKVYVVFFIYGLKAENKI